ncbi:MAG: nuclear transport factor 2 family protein [Congregibacter sp.]
MSDRSEKSSDMIERLQARVDQLESRMAIQTLAYDYCHGFDKRDFDRFLNIWWDDCVWNIGPPFGVFNGHGGIRDAVHNILWPAWDESHHLTTNNVISFDSPDRARSICDVDCTGRLAGETVCQMVSATYADTLERRDDVWRIQRRDVTIHYFNPVPGTTLVKPEA